MTAGIWVGTFVGGKLKASAANVTVVIDGTTYKVPWGERFFAVAPGPHTVSVFWAMQRRKARGEIEVDVPEGGAASVRFDVPRFNWQPCKLSVVPT